MRLSVTAFCSCFNSRTLGRVRHKRLHPEEFDEEVSIHAPWEGCDYSGRQRIEESLPFQFTHPGKGATPWRSG